MKYGKKGIGPHVLIVFVVSFVLCFLVYFLINSLYGDEHEDCEFVEIEVIGAQKDGQVYRMELLNKGSRMVSVHINDKRESRYQLEPALQSTQIGRKGIDLVLVTDERILEFTPVLEEGGREYVCKEKIVEVNTGRLV